MKHNSSNILSIFLLKRLSVRVFILFLSLISAVFGVLSPYFQKELVDGWLGYESIYVIGFFSQMNSLELILAAFFSMLLSVFISILTVYLGVKESIIAQRICSQKLYQKVIRLKTHEKKNNTSGDMVTHYAVDIQGSGMLLEQTLPMGAGVLFPFILAPVVLWIGFGIPLWFSLAVIGFFVGIIVFFALRQAEFFTIYKKCTADRLSVVSEWVQNLKLIRVLHATDWFESKIFYYRGVETDNRVRMVTNGQTMGSFGSSITFFINIIMIVFLIYGLKVIPTPGELLALLWILAIFLSQPFRKIPWIITFTLDALTSIKRLQSFFNLEVSDVNDVKSKWKISNSPSSMQVNVSHLNLFYQDQNILNDISFKIQAGEFVAFVGEVGSGKTQLALSLIGETPAKIADYRLGDEIFSQKFIQNARNYIAYVPQESFIMSATIGENIALHYQGSKEKVFDSRYTQSIGYAQLPLEPSVFQYGLQSEIGEFGVNLSGGQKQRLSIGRSVYYNKPIVILDDSLSALDELTENKILKELFLGEWKLKTRILITHRLTVLPFCDRIFFLEKGELKAAGTYSELNEQSESFRRFMVSKNMNNMSEDIIRGK